MDVTSTTLQAFPHGKDLLRFHSGLRSSVERAGLWHVQVMITKIESSTEGARVKSGATVDDKYLRYGI